MGRWLTEKEKARISELHSKGNSYDEIREELGVDVSDSTIQRYRDYSRSGRTGTEKSKQETTDTEGEPKPSRSPSTQVEGQEVESAFIEEEDTRTQKKKPRKKEKKEVIEKDGRTYFLIKTAETSKIDNWEEKKKRLLDQGYKYLAVVDGEFEVFKEEEI